MGALRIRRVCTVVASAVLTGGMVAATASPAFADGSRSGGGPPGGVVYVARSAPGQNPHRDGSSCSRARFTTIQAGVHAATGGGTVVVCPGRYAGGVMVGKPINLIGRGAVIDATGDRNGVVVTSSHATVRGFTVTGALGEGILAEPPGALTSPMPPTSAGGMMSPISDVTIDHNVVNANNTGGDPRTHQCPATPSATNPLYPGDCGGGVHLDTVARSRVSDNVVTGNDDGILVTDDYGPAFGNLIAGNYVARNLYECGIVLPSHNPFSVTATAKPDGTFTVGALTPATGGVFGNVVVRNTVIGNGTFPNPMTGGSGSGVGVFAPSSGTAAYNNVVAYNFISGNGQAGFTIHAHYPGGEYVNGNQVYANTFGPNNLGGDFLDGPGTDPVTATTGILVFSAVPVDMVVAGNHIHGNSIGIWLTPDVSARGLATNAVSGATTPVFVSRVPYSFTGPALSTTAATAAVGALITANGSPTTYYVEYGTTPGFGHKTAPTSAGTKVLPVGFAVPLTGLSAGQTIYYQVVATNAHGVRSGGVMTFKVT